MGQLQGQDEDSGKSEATVSATLWSDLVNTGLEFLIP